ncbi:MAG: hypothetical protein ACREX8_18760, partial [Gammaproteobacteria bacterium]
MATGRFLPRYGFFLPLRPARIPASPPTPDTVDNPVDSVSDVDPKLPHWDGHVGFIVPPLRRHRRLRPAPTTSSKPGGTTHGPAQT